MVTMALEPVSRVLLADHDLPAEFATGHVEVRRITMAPDVTAGRHEHNGPVFGVIVTGSVDFQVADGATKRLGSGDTFYEPARTVIDRFDSTGEGVEFLAWFPLASGEPGLLTPLP